MPSEQTPVEFTFDSSLIGNDGDDVAQTRLARTNFPEMKYKSAVMSYGDLSSESYIRMSKNVKKTRKGDIFFKRKKNCVP